jgi:MFS family permease
LVSPLHSVCHLGKLYLITETTAWFIGGFTLAYTYAPFLIALLHTNDDTNPERSQLRTWVGWAIMLFFLVGILLSFTAPASCRRLFGGRVTEMSPHFVGFEGTLPLEELEKVVFGNYGSRLTYDPSSTKFALRHLEERRGMEPEWVTKSDSPPLLRDDHRVFTIVDTGNLTVSIIQTVNPPTVALICGREGGMLRALLCSWDFTSDTLYRETVMRLTSDCVDMAVTKSWLRVCLRQSPSG